MFPLTTTEYGANETTFFFFFLNIINSCIFFKIFFIRRYKVFKTIMLYIYGVGGAKISFVGLLNCYGPCTILYVRTHTDIYIYIGTRCCKRPRDTTTRKISSRPFGSASRGEMEFYIYIYTHNAIGVRGVNDAKPRSRGSFEKTLHFYPINFLFSFQYPPNELRLPQYYIIYVEPPPSRI